MSPFPQGVGSTSPITVPVPAPAIPSVRALAGTILYLPLLRAAVVVGFSPLFATPTALPSVALHQKSESKRG